MNGPVAKGPLPYCFSQVGFSVSTSEEIRQCELKAVGSGTAGTAMA